MADMRNDGEESGMTDVMERTPTRTAAARGRQRQEQDRSAGTAMPRSSQRTQRSDPAPQRGAAASAGRARRVRVPELLLGLLLVSGCALGAIVWHTSSTKRTPVLVAAQPIARGQVLASGDFTAAEVNAEGIALMPAARAEEFIGRIALVDLTAGSPITPDVAAAVVPLADDEALVGRLLEPGQYPSDLAVGDTVSIVMLADPSVQSATAPESSDPAAVAAPQARPRPGGLTETAAGGVIPATAQATAVVDSVQVAEGDVAGAVVTLRTSSGAARAVAAAKEVRLVEVG